MKNITILVTHHALIAAIGNARYLFVKINEFLKQSENPLLFDIKLIGLSKEMNLNGGLFKIEVDVTLEEARQTDLIIIPPMSGDMESGINLNKEYLPWIGQQYKKGAEVASLCVGSFLLAETGLLKGQKCSTHWQTAHEFRKRFPAVELVDDKIITDFNGIYTSGGANSYWNLLIYLVEKYVGRDIAIRASKYFEVEMDRGSQLPFRIFEGYKMHTDVVVKSAQKFIEENYNKEKITVDQLSHDSNLSRRTFHRRFKKATHLTVVTYIQKVKVEAAKKLLESNRLSVNEVMYEVGYNDPKAFRDVFKKEVGVSPLIYRSKFSL